jgi:hypothetical protein
VAKLYADDFEAFGYPTTLDPGTAPLLLPAVAVQLLETVRRRNRRIAQLLQL